jgi:hypothetical protein
MKFEDVGVVYEIELKRLRGRDGYILLVKPQTVPLYLSAKLLLAVF